MGSSSNLEAELRRIRQLSKSARYEEALAAAQMLAASEPNDRDAMYLVAANQRCLRRALEALTSLRRLEQSHPRFSLLYQERGYCYVSLRDAPRAIESFARGVELNPALLASWTMLAQLLRMTGQLERAETAAEQVSKLSQLAPEVVRAGSLFSDGDFEPADEMLRSYVDHGNEDAEAFRLLGRIQQKRELLDDAESWLKRTLCLRPEYLAARLDYARVLAEQQKYLCAQQELNVVLDREPDNLDVLSLEAAVCVGLGRYERALDLYEEMLRRFGESAEVRVALGHVLKTLGRQQEAVGCYRTATRLQQGFGDAWWSLANLKTYCFSAGEIACMQAQEAQAEDVLDRYHLSFALGKAYEDEQDYANSWRFYERGNELKRKEVRYDPCLLEKETRAQVEVFTRAFFAERAGSGKLNCDPIFIVGLPRSGSTLVEQILASHSLVEGTQELPYIPQMVARLERAASGLKYPAFLRELGTEQWQELGERYLRDAGAHRNGRPFFIDKMPNNFRYVGLIHLMLPNAKIIDVRRDAVACCFSNLKQLFAKGQEFTYNMGDLVRYYKSYVGVMRHWDEIFPGRVLRVHYEDVVADLNGSVRRILEFCGLPFEADCLAFYKTQRGIYTPSSEQVRQPISRDGLTQWRNYEQWLWPLRDGLGEDGLTDVVKP